MSTPDVASWGRRAMLPKLERIRFTLPIVGYDMERLELQSFYELGGHIANLENLTRLPRNAKWNAATINAIAAALTGVVESDALTLLAVILPMATRSPRFAGKSPRLRAFSCRNGSESTPIV